MVKIIYYMIYIIDVSKDLRKNIYIFLKKIFLV